MALQDNSFVKGYKEHHRDFKLKDNKEKEKFNPNRSLIESLLSACKNVLSKNKITGERQNTILKEYEKVEQSTALSSISTTKDGKEKVNTRLRDLIGRVHEDILPYINEKVFDLLGKFYTQFIRYAGSDKKTGLVLTPQHITDFFCEIGSVDKDDVVFDPCCGTGGFLVSAMKYMISSAGNNLDKHKEIKDAQIIGCETRADMFSHVCSNMMMRGDGKSHIYNKDCFDSETIANVKTQKPNKVFLNPPYDKGEDEQLRFVENALNCILKDGLCVAICQMSTVVSSKFKTVTVRQRLLEKHTLEAVFSMPDDLFYPIGVITCILIFKAHTPHPENKETFFGYFKDDGFQKRKWKGRIDVYDRWEEIKNKWHEAYINKKNIPGLSVVRYVTAHDEWCAEAYMETDYSILTNSVFTKTIHNYVGFQFSVGILKKITDRSLQNKQISLNTNGWKSFLIIDVFDKIFRGKRLTKADRINGNILYFSASDFNNGWTDSISNALFVEKNAIIYTTFGTAYYISTKFTASDEISILKHKALNKYNGMFVATIISQNKYKYSFGRKAFRNKFDKDFISLPVTIHGEPDWQFMENYIKSLPYSANL